MIARTHLDGSPRASRRRVLLGAVAASAALVQPVIAQEPHPDAALLALGRELDALWAEERTLFACCNEDAPEIAAIEARCDAVVRRIVPIAAITLDGFIVKARACAYCHNGEPINGDTFEHGPVVSIQIVGLMVRDLLAIEAARVSA